MFLFEVSLTLSGFVLDARAVTYLHVHQGQKRGGRKGAEGWDGLFEILCKRIKSHNFTENPKTFKCCFRYVWSSFGDICPV